MKKWMVVGLLCMGISSITYAKEPVNVNEISAVAVNYQGKAYIRGEYEDLSSLKYKVYCQNGTTYLPLRLTAKMISTPTEDWSVNWNSSKPNEVILVCTYMEEIEGGTSSTGRQKVMQLSVGSTQAKIDGRRVTLSRAPKKINGSVTLPMRSIGELLGKQVSYKDGLIIISQTSYDEKDKTQDHALKEIKKQLEQKPVAAKDQDWAQEMTTSGGKCYYSVYHLDEKTQKSRIRLYEQIPGRSPKLIKDIAQECCVSPALVNDCYYYVHNGELYAYHLKTGKETAVVRNEGEKLSGMINGLFINEGKLYLIVHEGDWTMGWETLYEVKEGRLQKMADAHSFGSIVMEGDNVYYSVMDNMTGSPNLFIYNRKSRQQQELGSKDKIYGIGIEVTPQGSSSWINKDAFIWKGSLYTLAYSSNEEAKGAAVYAINLADHTERQITGPTTKYWHNGQQLYYLASDTGFLERVDLGTLQTKTMITKPIAKAEMKGNVIYYSLKGATRELGQGLYSYDLIKGVSQTITDKPIASFKSGSTGVVYIAKGAEPGIYKWSAGKNTVLEKGWVYQTVFGENSLWYCLYDKAGNFVISF